MWGAIATHVAAVEPGQLCSTVCGLVVVDVVEGTAIEALTGMDTNVSVAVMIAWEYPMSNP